MKSKEQEKKTNQQNKKIETMNRNRTQQFQIVEQHKRNQLNNRKT